RTDTEKAVHETCGSFFSPLQRSCSQRKSRPGSAENVNRKETAISLPPEALTVPERKNRSLYYIFQGVGRSFMGQPANNDEVRILKCYHFTQNVWTSVDGPRLTFLNTRVNRTMKRWLKAFGSPIRLIASTFS